MFLQFFYSRGDIKNEIHMMISDSLNQSARSHCSFYESKQNKVKFKECRVKERIIYSDDNLSLVSQLLYVHVYI